MLQVQQVSLAYGERELLKDVSFTLPKGVRAALAGANGSGKSTLLQIIASLIPPDSGSVVHSSALRLSYLKQAGVYHVGTTLFEEVKKGYDYLLPLLEQKRELEEALHHGSKEEALLHQLHAVQEQLLQSGYWDQEARIDYILKGLGFAKGDGKRNCEEFSGGWQMRIALAKVLIEDPDIALLDEPTNYLDIEARIWLRSYLKQFAGSIIIVSHDQDFLDETVTEVYELFLGQLKRYSGTYSSYLIQRQAELEQLEKAYKQQQKELQRTEQFIQRFRYKASKARQVKSRVLMMEKIVPIEIPPHLKQISFNFPSPPPSGNDVLVVDNLGKSYGEHQIFKNLSFFVNKKDRLAVAGRNGAGKSTLLRLLAQAEASFSGNITYGSNVKIGYFAQNTEGTLNQQNTVLEEVEAVADTADIPSLRNLLGSFLFSGDDVDKKVSILSGGERSRLALAKILLQPANLLILDEPTNHLDIFSMNVLLKAISRYQGTVIFVSHDTHFINHLATRILYLSDQEPLFFEGDYSYFSWKLEQLQAQEKTIAPPSKQETSVNSLSYKEANRLKNRLQNIEKEQQELIGSLEEIENELEEVLQQMAHKENYSSESAITALVAKKKELEQKRADNEELWFVLGEEKEKVHESLL
jgi:ATP-binding cassette subfamily F protein 3